MRLLELVTKEYLTIVENLEESEPIINNRIIIDREHFRNLLEKYQYMKFKDKTKVYKDLNFIIHDKNNYTMPYKDVALNKTVRKVIINYATYATLKYLYENNIDL